MGIKPNTEHSLGSRHLEEFECPIPCLQVVDVQDETNVEDCHIKCLQLTDVYSSSNAGLEQPERQLLLIRLFRHRGSDLVSSTSQVLQVSVVSAA